MSTRRRRRSFSRGRFVWNVLLGIVASLLAVYLAASAIDGSLQTSVERAPETTAAATATADEQTSTPGAVSASAQLDALPVKGRSPKTGYGRQTQFGAPWFDLDQNGCSTRNDVLARDLVVTQLAADGCKVLAGSFIDPYTGRHIDFIHGEQTSPLVQIDHVVALSDAWQKGAQALSAEQRRALANDPLNLLAVDGPTNSSKGASDAASWLPPNKAFRCEYVARQISVKTKYSLWVTLPERDAMRLVLTRCAG